jgi:uncharacterized protein (TIGR02118 family)
MIRLVVLFGQPADVDAFNAHYFDVHLALANKIPGVRRNDVSLLSSADDSPAPFHLMAELYFDDRRALQAAITGPEAQAGAADVGNFATGGMTMFISETQDLPQATGA